jgi:hypothetical protein
VETKTIPRPLILLMDNLSVHISIRIIELAQKNQVILLCLPPNTSNAVQPLDVVPFEFIFATFSMINGITSRLCMMEHRKGRRSTANGRHHFRIDPVNEIKRKEHS